MHKKYHYISLSSLILIITGFCVFQYNPTIALECQYTDVIHTCETSDTPRSEEFICTNVDGYEELVYQYILDKKFTEIDDKIEEYIIDLEDQKNYYFGSEKKEHYTEGVDEIFRKFGVGGEYYVEFKKICGPDGIITEAKTCSPGESVSIYNSLDFYDNGGDCMDLAMMKLGISKEVVFNILNLNKLQIKKDQGKKYMQKQRSKYDELMEIMDINRGYMMDILHKTPSLTKNPH